MHLSATGHSLYDCSHSYFFFSTPVCKTTVIIGVKYRFVNNERAKVDKKVDKVIDKGESIRYDYESDSVRE